MYPVLDKAVCAHRSMNDRHGADLDDAIWIWVDQQRQVIKSDGDLRDVATHNDRSQHKLVLDWRT